MASGKLIKVKESVKDQLKSLESKFGTNTFSSTIETLIAKADKMDLLEYFTKETVELKRRIHLLESVKLGDNKETKR